MTLQQLKYVIGIADSGSFNKAAEKLFVSQPSLTSTIHDLEAELGISIFNRTGRGITLAVKSFVEMVKNFNTNEYEFAIRETRTRNVIEEVAAFKSEIGILYLSEFNHKAITSILKSKDLEFHHLIDCKAYVYIWKGHPLAKEKQISLMQLEDYPCLSFEQGDESSFYFAEEILSTEEYHRTIKANDRATMLNLMIGLNGYTLCSGIICEELNGSDYVAIPFREEDDKENRIMEIGWITRKGFNLSTIGTKYIEEVKKYLGIKS